MIAPFLLEALGSSRAVRAVGWFRRRTRTMQIIGGVLLVAVGAGLATDPCIKFVSWVRNASITTITLPT